MSRSKPRIVNAITPSRADRIRRLVIDSLPRPVSVETGEIIFGPGGALDSLDLVNFVADLEYRIADEFGCEVVLASEQAMSRSRSPFRDVGALVDYVGELLPA